MIGVGAEGPYDGTSYGILGEEWNWQADTRLSGSAGAVLAAHAPEAWLPGPLADAHLGLIGQMYVDRNRGDHTRYGIEVGAAVALSLSLSLGLDVQAVRFSRWSLTQAFTHQGSTTILRTSVAPIVRLGYTPRRTR